jgi:hypothetical protein
MACFIYELTKTFLHDCFWGCLQCTYSSTVAAALAPIARAASDSPRPSAFRRWLRMQTKRQIQALVQQTAKLALTSDKRSSRIQIDGSILEGGGQSIIPHPRPRILKHAFVSTNKRAVLRNASAYACICRKPVQITNIRGKRPVPGLKQQHVSGLQLLERISCGSLEGGRVQSSDILLRPGKDGITEAEFTSDQNGGGYSLLLFWRLLTAKFDHVSFPVRLAGPTFRRARDKIDFVWRN